MKSISIFIFLVTLSTIVIAQKKQTVFDDVSYNVKPVSIINTIASDISPAFVNDSIYFSGVSEKHFNNRRGKRNIDFYNVYSASIDKRGIIFSSRSLVPEFGNEFHEGPVTFCEATGELFVTVSNTNDFDAVQKIIPVANIRFHLLIKKRIEGKWQTVEELPFNDKRFHFAHPAISITGDTLVFSSDLKPNYGKSDLFMSIRKNGEWSAPVNLGNEINTPGSELFPTFIAGNILSFASNGRAIKKGGLDIYYSHFPELNKVEILGSDINTPFDDFGLIIHKNGNIGYFSSNRNQKWSDDIYQVDIIKLYKIFNGKIIDSDTNLPIANAEIILKNCTGEIINKLYSDSIGNFSFEILKKDCAQIETIKDGYENILKNITDRNNLEFRLKLKQYYEILVLNAEDSYPVDSVSISYNDVININTNSQGIVSLTPPLPADCEFLIQKDEYLNQTLTPKVIDNTAITRDTVRFYKKELNTIFFLSNINSVSGELKIIQETRPVFDQIIKVLKLNPDIKVELGWHTDSRGEDSDNKRLSQNRAAFAVVYIVNNGIERSRIIGIGYGESQLLNRCKNEVQCSEEEHRENRRIELKIIGFIKPQQDNTQEE